MIRLFLASAICATTVPAYAEIIAVQSGASHEVRIMRGAPDRCTDGPVIIRLNDASAAKTVRCASANAQMTSSVTVNNTIAIVIDRKVIDRKHKHHHLRRR